MLKNTAFVTMLQDTPTIINNKIYYMKEELKKVGTAVFHMVNHDALAVGSMRHFTRRMNPRTSSYW